MSSRPHELIWAIGDLAAVAAACASASWLIWGLVRTEPRGTSPRTMSPVAADPTPNGPAQASSPASTLVQVPGSIWPCVEPVPVAEASVPARRPNPPPLELLGIVLTSAGTDRAAMLYDTSSDAIIVLSADENLNGVGVARVDQWSVTISYQGEEHTLTLTRPQR